jgi:hypothetical protein
MNPNNFSSKENLAMRKRYGSWAAGLLAVFGILFVTSTGWALGTIKHYPTLSLRNFHVNPDGIQRVPQPGPGGERYFLVPVYIYNEVDTLFNPNFDGIYQGQHLEPIRSFEFQVYYPAQALVLDTVHGSPVVVIGPDPNGQPALAKTFFTRVSDQPVPVVPDPNQPGNHDPFRHVIHVSASSSVPLPLANTSDSGAVLLWLRFKVIPANVNAAEMFLDTSLFNDHRGDPDLNPTDFNRGNFGGGQGVGGQQKKGYGLVQLTPQPIIEFRPFSQVTTSDNVNFDLTADLIYDPTVGGQVTRQLQLRNGIGGTDLTNITFCSDQQWLMVGTSAGAGNQCDFISVIHYTGVGSEEKNIYLSVPNAAGLAPGIYFGTVTFVSDGAGNSPAKLRVRFIRLANPNEPSSTGGGTGIRLNISNSCAPVCTNTLTFGTGVGASTGIDLLYGERAFTRDDSIAADTNVIATSRCFAYFEPLDKNADVRFQDANFLGITRDIRSDAPTGTLVYKVNFSAGSVNCYPVKVCVDPNDFPAGGRVILRFTLNGSEQGIDLRQATVDPNTGIQRCVTISDRRINTFYIEYTPGTTVNLTNILPNAWNLISLPVIPPNPDARVIFPNAGGVPYAYHASIGWDPPIAGQLEFGRGYMIKYGSYLGTDQLIAGVRSFQIRNVRLDEGWNTIGAASTTQTTDFITLTPLVGQQHVPQLVSDVWEFLPTMGYVQTTFLKPGHGYFIKTDAAGFYNLDAPVQATAQSGSDMAGKLANGVASLQSGLSQVIVRDARGNGQELFFGAATSAFTESRFEMPAMASSFDARFDANKGNTSLNHSSYVVDVRSSSYPVTMNFTSLQGEVVVRDMQGNVLGNVSGTGSVTIADANVHQVEIAQKGDNGRAVTGFNLEQNVPNPFNGITSIGFNLPEQSEISLVIYNELGQVVRTLVSGTVGAGYHSVPFDASELANGTYYYTLKAGNNVKTIRMQLAK